LRKGKTMTFSQLGRGRRRKSTLANENSPIETKSGQEKPAVHDTRKGKRGTLLAYSEMV